MFIARNVCSCSYRKDDCITKCSKITTYFYSVSLERWGFDGGDQGLFCNF